MKSLIVCALCALFTAVALAAPRPPRPIPACPDPVPRCPDGRPAIDQWTAANELADLYCAAHPEIPGPACVASVVGGWCSSERDCAALICGDAREVLDVCRAEATAGNMPGVCWTLFQ